MIKVSTRVSSPQTADWVQVVRDTSTVAGAGSYRVQFGTGGEESTPDGSVPVSEFERGELVKALGGVWPK